MSLFCYLTAPSRSEAIALARLLLAKKLCAGLNIVPGAHSLYWWKGEVREKEEWLLFAQVARENAEKFVEAAKNAHPYAVPCIVCLPISSGYPPFLEWIEKNGQEGD